MHIRPEHGPLSFASPLRGEADAIAAGEGLDATTFGMTRHWSPHPNPLPGRARGWRGGEVRCVQSEPSLIMEGLGSRSEGRVVGLGHDLVLRQAQDEVYWGSRMRLPGQPMRPARCGRGATSDAEGVSSCGGFVGRRSAFPGTRRTRRRCRSGNGGRRGRACGRG